jgi:hypothetical protein
MADDLQERARQFADKFIVSNTYEWAYVMAAFARQEIAAALNAPHSQPQKEEK